MHYKRSEHWVVVKGKAKITNGKDEFTLLKNESTYIPVETVHALENPSNSENLEIIEVQTGTYFGEDDIVRFEDRYGRIAENENKK
jgi:mannose-1-phosphate guanylyltransferase